jgi:hypothetical protein
MLPRGDSIWLSWLDLGLCGPWGSLRGDDAQVAPLTTVAERGL